MSAAALTPRVRILVLCDEVLESETEQEVFTLVGVRQHLGGGPLPVNASLSLFLVLSSPRKGRYRGNVVIVRVATDKTLRYSNFQVAFDEDNQVVPCVVDLGWCEFREAGLYAVQVWFSPREGQDVLKAELTFEVLENEE
jgi:hypothetical protein